MVATTQVALLLAAVSNVAGADYRNAKPSYTKPEEYVSIVLDGDNELRAAKGLPPLCNNQKLQTAAQTRAYKKANSDYFEAEGEFDLEDLLTDIGFAWDTAVGNYSMAGPNASSMVGGKFSLDNYTMVGTAYAFNNRYGVHHFWVQVFATSSTEECDPEVDPVSKSSTEVPGQSETSCSGSEGIQGTVSPTTGQNDSAAAKMASTTKTGDCE